MVVRKSSRVKKSQKSQKSQKSLFRRSGSKKAVKKTTKSRRISKKSNKKSVKKSVKKSNKKSVKKSNKKSVKKSVKKSNKKSVKKSVKKSNKNNDVLVKYDAVIMLYSTVRNKKANNTTYDIRYYVGAGKQVVVTNNKGWESYEQYDTVRGQYDVYDAADIKQIKSWFGRLVKVLPIKQFKMVHVSDNVFNFSFMCSVKKQAEVLDTLTDYMFRIKTSILLQNGEAYNVRASPLAKIPRVFAHKYTVVFGVGFKSHDGASPTPAELDQYVSTHANQIKELPLHMFNYEPTQLVYLGGPERQFGFTMGSNLLPKEVARQLKTAEPRGSFYYLSKNGTKELGYLFIDQVVINGKKY